MHWLSVLGIGIAANLDNLGIGVSFGARSTKVTVGSNLVIASLSMLAAYISIALGKLAMNYIPSALANWGGGTIIVIIGLLAIRSDLKSRSQRRGMADGIAETDVDADAGAGVDTGMGAKRAAESASMLRNPLQADRNGDRILSWRESLALGAALAMNCIAGGFGAGVTGLSPAATTLSIGLFSLVTIETGVRAGRRLSRTWFGEWSNLIGGLLLVCIGVYEMIV